MTSREVTVETRLVDKLAVAAWATFGYLVTLALVYWIHARYFTVDVVLYAAIFDAVGVAFAAGVMLLVWRRFDCLGRFEKGQMVVIWLLLGTLLALGIPTVVDRSLSFYILEKLQQRGGAIRVSGIDSVFREEYMREHRLIDVRLTEQLASGTIYLDGDCVLLTQWGDVLATASRAFRTHVLPRRRLLMGEYTADLTDPFRDSVQNVSYECTH